MADDGLLVLDGSHGEGGGQILRTALFLSVLTGRGFRMDKIRQNRSQPGLKPQHLGIVRLLAEMTQSRTEDLRVGASQMSFSPGRLRGGDFRYDIGTAGSIPLFLQTILPAMLATPGRTSLEIIGGTDVTFGPTIDWVRRTYAPLIEPIASTMRIDVERRGFYPKGGGQVRILVENASGAHDLAMFQTIVRQHLRTPRLAWTEPAKLELISVAHAELKPRNVAERQAHEAKEMLARAGRAPTIQILYTDSYSIGSSLTLVATDANGNRMGADGLGAQGTTAEAVGGRVAQTWLRDAATGAAVDEHLADHLVPWIALGAGPVRVPRMTGHLETNVWVCQRFLGPESVGLDGLVVRSMQK